METTMSSLLIANIPHDCEENEVHQWITERVIRILGLKLITDVVSHTSPSFAHVQLRNAADAESIAQLLDGQRWKNNVLRVKPLKTVQPTASLRFRVGA